MLSLSKNHFDMYELALLFCRIKRLVLQVLCNFCNIWQLVKNPSKKFSKLLGWDGDLIQHDKHQYHRDAVKYAENFKRTYSSRDEHIVNILDSKSKEQIKSNREKLQSIIESIIFLGRARIYLFEGTGTTEF